jgi:hypothetical protein
MDSKSNIGALNGKRRQQIFPLTPGFLLNALG